MKAAWVNLVLGLVLLGFSIPMWLEKVPMNRWYGVRIQKSFESEENWYRINRFGGMLGVLTGLAIALVGVACLLWPPAGQGLELLLLFVPSALVLPWLVATLWYASKL